MFHLHERNRRTFKKDSKLFFMDIFTTNRKPELVPGEANGKAPTGSCEISFETGEVKRVWNSFTLQNVLFI